MAMNLTNLKISEDLSAINKRKDVQQVSNDIIHNLIKKNNDLQEYNQTLKGTIRLLKRQMDEIIEDSSH